MEMDCDSFKDVNLLLKSSDLINFTFLTMMPLFAFTVPLSRSKALFKVILETIENL